MNSLINKLCHPVNDFGIIRSIPIYRTELSVEKRCINNAYTPINTSCGIYKITNPKGKIYIGQAVNFRARLNKYRRLKCNRQPLIYNSLLKYGFENHKFEIIHICQEYKLDDLEVYYIKLYDCFNTPCGLNLQSGGHNN